MASTIAHQSDLTNFRLPVGEVGDTEFRLCLGHTWVVSSRNCFAEVFFPHVISLLSTHHDVLDRPSGCPGPLLSAICLCLHPCDLRYVERGGAAAAFKFASFWAFAFFFDFVVLTQSHSVDVSCWSALMIPSLSRIAFRSFFSSHCVFFK